MRTITTTFTAAATGALVLAGTAAGTATAASSSACTGVSGCTVVSRADVDGDGRADSVGTTQTKRTDGTGTTTVRVRTASGTRMSTTTELERPVDKPFYGAARIDGAPGYELVVNTGPGAHTGWFRVITYRDGRLTTLRDPNGAYRWTVDAASWIGKGYRRTTTSTGALKMMACTALDTEHDGTFRLQTTAVTWRNGGWSRLGRTTRTVGPSTAYRYADWSVPYLEKYYR